MKEELLKGLTEKQVAKINACKGQEEILKVLKEEGIELTDEQLEAISGGWGSDRGVVGYCKCGYSGFCEYVDYPFVKCPKCGATMYGDLNPHVVED